MPSVGSFKAEALPKNYVGIVASKLISVADINAWAAANTAVTSVGSQYLVNGTLTATVGPTTALSVTVGNATIAVGSTYRNLGKTIRIGTSGQPDALVLQLVQIAGTSANNGQPSSVTGTARGYVVVANNATELSDASLKVAVARA